MTARRHHHGGPTSPDRPGDALRRGRPFRPTRRGAIALAATGLLLPLGACTRSDPAVETVDGVPATAVLPSGDAAAAALALSTTLLTSADAVLLATEETVPVLADLGLRRPLLMGTSTEVAREIRRLGAGTLVTAAGTELAAITAELGELEVVEVDPDDPAAADLPDPREDVEPFPATVLTDPEGDAAVLAVTQALAAAAGAPVAEVAGGDPRRDEGTVAVAGTAVGEDPSAGVLAVGGSFGSTEELIARLTTATTVPQIPGGGQQVWPGRRMVALYGTPGVPSLGVLGEQDLEATIQRVQDLAAEYEGLSEEPVLPAFEIITTIASSQAGSDGDYSAELDPSDLQEWVDAAGEAGISVVLDLQPGTTDFLTQAQRYEELLLAPHVGLALDSEWRLEPGQKHLEQIGSVTAAEVNETARWLADLVTEHALPQKLLILHQFSLSMIQDREDVDTSREELAITLHADGHGAPGDKLATYAALQQDLPGGIHLAWKNFYDEDSPTFTPEETMAVEPRPWFVSYQ